MVFSDRIIYPANAATMLHAQKWHFCRSATLRQAIITFCRWQALYIEQAKKLTLRSPPTISETLPPALDGVTHS